MKKLLYVPVIHMDADLGSLSGEMVKRGIKDYGEEFWNRHRQTISGFWDTLASFFSAIKVEGFKVYQDGMVADGDMGRKIVDEGVKSGSKNYIIVDDLLKRGAVLVKTEAFNLVKEERDYIVGLMGASSAAKRTVAFLKYKARKNSLLRDRDAYIAQRITKTLNAGETGVLFIGAFHNVRTFLPEDIHVLEIKDIKMIREYQKLIPLHKKNMQALDKLAAELVAPVTPESSLFDKLA